MYKNKSNISIVKSYLAGERPFVKVGYSVPEIKREIGSTWVDNQDVKWEQKDGYKTRINEQANIIKAAMKRKCKCGQEIQYGSRLDEVFFSKTGKCFDCIIKEETEYRVLGVYPQYEAFKLLSNYLGFLEDMKQKIEDSIKYFQTEDGTLQILCNSEGFLEKFKGINTEELLVSAKNDLSEITKLISKTSKDKKKAKKTFNEDLKKTRKNLTSSIK